MRVWVVGVSVCGGGRPIILLHFVSNYGLKWSFLGFPSFGVCHISRFFFKYYYHYYRSMILLRDYPQYIIVFSFLATTTTTEMRTPDCMQSPSPPPPPSTYLSSRMFASRNRVRSRPRCND